MTAPAPASGFGRLSVVHAGVEYAGEWVQAARWDDAFGSQLCGDTYFRVVFLEQWPPPALASLPLRDGRIAVCLLGQDPGHELAQANQELRVLREAQAQYLAVSGGTEASQQEVEEQLQQLQGRLEWVWSRAYGLGHIVTQQPLRVDPIAILTGGGPQQWAERLGRQLLALAYPELPFYSNLLEEVLKPQEHAPQVFYGLRNARLNPTEGHVLETFAPALGVASPDAPKTLDLSHCFVSQVIRTELTSAGGIAQGESLGWRLAHVHGLTYSLATLFTLLFLTQGDWEVRLRPGHSLVLLNGRPLDSDRLVAADVPNLALPVEFWQQVEWVGPLERDRSAVGQTGELEEQRRLRQWMDEMASGLQLVTGKLEELVQAQGCVWDPSQVPYLPQLQTVAGAKDELVLAETAEQAFGGFPQFRAAMETWRGWDAGLAVIGQLIDALSFVDLAVVPEEMVSLFTDRQLLLSRLRSGELLAVPHQ